MLVVKQILSEKEDEVAYEATDNGQSIGKLVARFQPDGTLMATVHNATRHEVPRTLLSRLERDARANAVRGIYFEAQDLRQREHFAPAGYEPVNQDSLLLFKNLL